MESKPLTEWKGRNSPIHHMLMYFYLKVWWHSWYSLLIYGKLVYSITIYMKHDIIFMPWVDKGPAIFSVFDGFPDIRFF